MRLGGFVCKNARKEFWVNIQHKQAKQVTLNCKMFQKNIEMRKLIFGNLLILLFLSATLSISAQERNRILSNGFSFNCIVGFVPDSYAFIKGKGSADRNIGMLIGGEFGNRWYHPINSKLAFGAMINWLEVSLTQRKNYVDYEGKEVAILEVVLLETGPIITYALNSKTGIDGFYNVRPSLIDDSAFAVTQCVGLGLRRNALMLNFEYVFGKYPSGEYINSEPVDKNINHARVSFGFKF